MAEGDVVEKQEPEKKVEDKKGWSRKPRLLFVGDSAAIHTGFARVIKEVFMDIYNKDIYDIKQIGWFHRPTEEIVPWQIIPTKKDSPQMAQKDQYGAITFSEVVNKWKPDLVFALGDAWMVEPIANSPERNSFKLVLYAPIDGMPIPKKWAVDTFSKADVMVAYGEFGQHVIRGRVPTFNNLISIPHGVDTETFSPNTEKQIKNIKRQFGGEDMFIVGTVARNQPRKNIPRLLKVAKMFINPYTVCNSCGELELQKIDVCHACSSEDLTYGEPKNDVRFYFHMALQDCGWDIYELIQRLGLVGKIAYPKGLQVGMGVEIGKLVEIMNGFDVFTLPTSGEGWGLPILEAMSCGLPVLVTNYSAHVEFCQGAADLIKVSEFVTEPLTNIERALVDLHDYCMRLDRMYYDDKKVFWKKWGKYIFDNEDGISEDNLITGKRWRKMLGGAARQKAEKYQWQPIRDRWIELFNNLMDYNPKTIEKKDNIIEYTMEEV